MRWLVVFTVVALACADPAAPEPAGFEFELTSPAASSVEVVDGRIVVRGTITGPCSPYEVRGRAEGRALGIFLVVIGEDLDGFCPLGVVQETGYRAVIRPPRGRSWRVWVVHRWADLDREDQVIMIETLEI